MNFGCKVTLDESNKICYFGGDIISGTIHLQTYKEYRIQSLYVFLEGVVLVDWKDINSKIRHGFIVYNIQRYRDQLRHNYDIQILDKDRTLHVGSLVYNFSLAVPSIAQSTCILKQGHIKYKLRVHLIGEECSHILQKIPIIINRKITTDIPLDLLKPVEKKFVDSYWWWPFQSNPASITLCLPVTLYAPGECMSFTLILNNTNRFSDIQRISMILLQKQELTSNIPKKSNHIDYLHICRIMYEKPCTSMKKRKLHGVLQLPDSIPPTTEINSMSSKENNLITITYILTVVITMGGFSFDGSFSIPISIGHYNKYQLTLKELSPETKYGFITNSDVSATFV